MKERTQGWKWWQHWWWLGRLGWGGYTLNTTGYYHGGPSLIHIPLIPVGNLLDRHTWSKRTHTQTNSHPYKHTRHPHTARTHSLIENGHNGVDGFSFRWGRGTDWSLYTCVVISEDWHHLQERGWAIASIRGTEELTLYKRGQRIYYLLNHRGFLEKKKRAFLWS